MESTMIHVFWDKVNNLQFYKSITKSEILSLDENTKNIVYKDLKNIIKEEDVVDAQCCYFYNGKNLNMVKNSLSCTRYV